MAEITSLDFPSERLAASKNLLLAEDRARTREDLLTATALAPVLFDGEDKAEARVSKAAEKTARARLPDPAHGEALPVHSIRTLPADLATLTKNTICCGGKSLVTVLAMPTIAQSRAV
jgi:hypothetical protein